MAPESPAEPSSTTGSRELWRRVRDLRHLRVVIDSERGGRAEPPLPPVSGGNGRDRWRKVLVAVALFLVALFATTKLTFSGHLYGLYLLHTESGRPLELKDDLRLGDGPHVIAGVSFSGVRELLSRGHQDGPRLEVDWDEAQGGGVITNTLGDGRVVQTVFGRYLDDKGRPTHGLFVGGAIAEVAAVPAENQSGMAVRDAAGWHHVWCTVNEGLIVDGIDHLVPPSEWTLTGSRVLVDSERRVVIQSEHELRSGEIFLRMERYAYFTAGRPFFRLGVNVFDMGERAVRLHYAYGDEPWVGEFGSAAGNIGWTANGPVTAVSWFDAGAEPWAGIADLKTGMANFLAWEGSRPDRAFFGNHAGSPQPDELGAPLASNEVAIGLEWLGRIIEPDGLFSVKLTIGLADRGPDGRPALPEGVLNPR